MPWPGMPCQMVFLHPYIDSYVLVGVSCCCPWWEISLDGDQVGAHLLKYCICHFSHCLWMMWRWCHMSHGCLNMCERGGLCEGSIRVAFLMDSMKAKLLLLKLWPIIYSRYGSLFCKYVSMQLVKVKGKMSMRDDSRTWARHLAF